MHLLIMQDVISSLCIVQQVWRDSARQIQVHIGMKYLLHPDINNGLNNCSAAWRF